MSESVSGVCQVCGKKSRLHPIEDARGGFLITRLCHDCKARVLSQSQMLRAKAVVIALGLQMNPEGGVVPLGVYDYKITRVVRPGCEEEPVKESPKPKRASVEPSRYKIETEPCWGEW